MADAPVLGAACAHCGLAVPFGRRGDGHAPDYCCSGCEAAAAILRAGGLAEAYHRGAIRQAPVRPSGRDFAEFDHPAFADLYVHRGADGRAEVELYLEGVHCASCVWLVERIPLLADGVMRTELDLPRARARVAWDPAALPLSAIARLLDRLGYPPHPFHGVAREAMRRREDRAALTRIGVAGALAGNVMLMAFALYAGDASGMAADARQLFRWGSFLLTVPALLFPGRVFLAGAWGALRARTLHMDVPIAIALLAAIIRGAINTVTATGPVYFDGVTLLIFLLLVGRYLQQRGQRAAADAAELLHALTPRSARVVGDDGSEREVPVEALLPGMEIAVAVGDALPADGTVTVGCSTMNLALLTGESAPVEVAPGDVVYAGTENLTAPLRCRIEAAGSASRLSRLLQMVEEGARRRAPIVTLAQRLSGVFVGVVLVLAAATFLVWVGRDAAAAWDHAIALLVVTCPCALALATPLAVSTGIGRAARAGILIKGGDVLESLARPGLLVLDKTGTVTEGRHALRSFQGDAGLRQLILGLEAGSRHPVAEGFRRAWPGVAAAAVEDVHHDAAGGIIARWEGRSVAIGSPAFLAMHARAVPDVTTLTREGLTPVLLVVDDQVVARAGFGDPVRPEAAEALARLRSEGWATRLLSGDDPAVVARVGAELGFRPEDVTGGATPERKLAVIEALRARAQGRRVVMVGDGVNDAAAIAAADVGVGVHGGAEASLATADVHLVAPGLEPLVRLVEGSARTFAVIRRNMAWALAYNAIGVVLAMTGRISPLVAAILMPASSLTVILASWLGRSFDPGASVDAPVVAAAAISRRAAA